MHETDGVQRDIDPAGRSGDCAGKVLDGPFIQHIDLRRLDVSTLGSDVSCYGIELGLCSPGDEDLCAFPCEDPRNSTPDRTTASKNHSILVLKQHYISFASILLAKLPEWPSAKWHP